MKQYNNANLDGRPLSIELVSGMNPEQAVNTRSSGRGGGRSVQVTMAVRVSLWKCYPLH